MLLLRSGRSLSFVVAGECGPGCRPGLVNATDYGFEILPLWQSLARHGSSIDRTSL
jgi:hypothetical protein